jgi:hypothetical protein
MVGEKGHILPEASAEHLIHAFEFIGKMIAHAVKNGCHGFPGLSPAIQHYVVYGNPTFLEDTMPPVSIDDIAEKNLQDLMYKLYDGENLAQNDKELLQQWMEKSDCRVQLRENTRLLVLQHLLIYYVYTRRLRQIEALAKGLETFDLRKFLHENPTKENISMVFPSPEDIAITPELFMGVVITRGDGFDFATHEYFRQFVNELCAGHIENHTISDLVSFFTGSPYLPHRVVLSFSDNDVMPIAHACYNELQLPTRHHSYEAFKENMILGMAHHDYSLDSN